MRSIHASAYSKTHQSSSVLSEVNLTSTDFARMTLQEIVDTKKYQQLAAALKGVSKVELHAHLGGLYL